MALDLYQPNENNNRRLSREEAWQVPESLPLLAASTANPKHPQDDMKPIKNLQLYRSEQRLIEKRPGFQSFQSFNFGHNFRAGRAGFKALSVFNDDFVEHNTSIPLHPHANYEILSVVLEGEMSHEDNFGNKILVSGAFTLADQLIGRRDSAQFSTEEGFDMGIKQDSDIWLMVQPN